ncbi:hypothetical protein CSAL01_12179 [Colletotrichum salicis]|uniref:Alcohol dehydrogenase-like N-terminal domain-containing protein n=1 Tax=Colletotrichum salicis TaxID=1209931 RepID=A0A135V8J3_9PEZI|nr:hypothetical protein CSAL01_12179 [Colletotrichum salicis]
MAFSPSRQNSNRVIFLQRAEGTENLRAKLQTRPIPKATPGSVIVRVLAASVRANTSRISRNPHRGHALPLPFGPGHTAICRVSGISSDVTSLKVDQLIFIDPYIQARDGDGFYISAVMEGSTPESLKLSRGDWRDGTYADYAKLPIENCHILYEHRLLGDEKHGGLGYTIEELTHLFSMLAPFGGLSDIDSKPGGILLIAPATGRSGSAVLLAAIIVFCHSLRLSTHKSRLFSITGDIAKDAETIRNASRGLADAFWDMSPATAGSSTHFKSCLDALKIGARVSLVGGALAEVNFSYLDIISPKHNLISNLTAVRSGIMAQDKTKEVVRVIDAPISDVWAIIAAFGSEKLWFPNVIQSSLEGFGIGSIRTLTFNNGHVVHERLEIADPETHTPSPT